jgi:HEAT repeat protein
MKQSLALLLFAVLPIFAQEEERTHTEEQLKQLEQAGELAPEQDARPANLSDLTKGEPLQHPRKGKLVVWHLGPTGIIGVLSGDHLSGDQFLVQATHPGSPADGKILPGDVITGLNGKKFQAGGHLGILIGDAIIEAEREINAGKITFEIWRDHNYVKRNAKRDVAGVDIDTLFKRATDDAGLYDWQSDEQRTETVKKSGFDEFPIVPENLSVELTLRVLPEYSDTAPYDCPKTAFILEEAWKHLEQTFIADPKNRHSGRGGVIEAIALVASGKPEHREIVRQWVRGPHSPWKPPVEPIGAMFEPNYRGGGGKRSWHMGFTGLSAALYLDATGDDFVRPAVEKFAIETAMGQSVLGTWGHTFAFPSFNGGEFNQANPGYGALNAAGNRCFFLITLAKKLGIEDPRVDAAIERSRKFFGSFVDQGAIPYGDHGAADTDDSNGKNTGAAFAHALLGDDYAAKYFATMSTHASFTRRGGHAHDYHGNWSSWAAALCGPEVRIMAERNMRWRRTLCRLHDGSFVYISKYGALRNPTATEVLHQAFIHRQTLITGKEINPELQLKGRDLEQLLISARTQFNDDTLIEKVGPPMLERSTAELLDLLDLFIPVGRTRIADELGKRYLAGEAEILPKLLELLNHEQPRFRDGALAAIRACGENIVLENLTQIILLLDDPHDFVRIRAFKVMSHATGKPEVRLAMVKSLQNPGEASEPNSLGNTAQSILFATDTELANSPFTAGLDPDLVRTALENVLLLDPAGNRPFLGSRIDVWEQETVIPIAGTLVYTADIDQVGDQMFNSRSRQARDMLIKAGFIEGHEGYGYLARKLAAVRRDIRPHVAFKRPVVDPDAVTANPVAFKALIEPLQTVLISNPSMRVENIEKQSFALIDMYDRIATATGTPPPSIATAVSKRFEQELADIQGAGAQIRHCQVELKDPTKRTYFRQIAAMDQLAELLGPDAIADLVPYLGHPYWRVREHAQATAARLAKAGGAVFLTQAFAAESNPETLAGILDTLGESRTTSALATTRSAITHAHPAVRGAAIHATIAIGGADGIPEILAHLAQSKDINDLIACEEALLTLREDPAATTAIREGLEKILPNTDASTQRPVAYHILAKLGDTASIAILEKAGNTDSIIEFNHIVQALSYSPNRDVDAILLNLAAASEANAKAIAPHTARRMVLGPNGYGDITPAQQMDFAEPMLRHALDTNLIGFLSTIHEARALRTLLYCLEQGHRSAAENLIRNAESIDGDSLTPDDRKIAVEAVRSAIEYIEVTRLRGGPEARMGKDDNYAQWRALQARAGKALLQIHKPESAPIPTLDPLLLD